MKRIDTVELDGAVDSTYYKQMQDAPIQAKDVKSLIVQTQPQYQEDDILNIYVFGSRLYGTANQDSDYDLIVVVSDESFETQVSRIQEVTTSVNADKRKTGFIQGDCNGCKVDATLYSKSYFVQKMNMYNIYELSALWSPAPFKLQEQFDPLLEWKQKDDDGYPCISLSDLRTRISSQCTNVWKMCRQWFTDALKLEDESKRDVDMYKAKKGLIAALRIFAFGAQIAQSGKITDWTCANEYMRHEWVTDPDMRDYEKFYAHFQPYKVKLHHAFADVAKK
jgi:predicted nucleotidyltransferase